MSDLIVDDVIELIGRKSGAGYVVRFHPSDSEVVHAAFAGTGFRLRGEPLCPRGKIKVTAFGC